jgi:predicted lipid carrier protein YhbT
MLKFVSRLYNRKLSDQQFRGTLLRDREAPWQPAKHVRRLVNDLKFYISLSEDQPKIIIVTKQEIYRFICLHLFR